MDVEVYKQVSFQTSLVFFGIIFVIACLIYVVIEIMDQVARTEEINYHEHDTEADQDDH